MKLKFVQFCSSRDIIMLLQGIVKNIVCYNIFLIQMMMTLPAALMGAPLSLELISTRELDIPSHHFSLSKVCIGSQCVQSWACLTALLSCKQKQNSFVMKNCLPWR